MAHLAALRKLSFDLPLDFKFSVRSPFHVSILKGSLILTLTLPPIHCGLCGGETSLNLNVMCCPFLELGRLPPLPVRALLTAAVGTPAVVSIVMSSLLL